MGTISVSVDVYPDEVIEQLSDDELAAELSRRRAKLGQRDDEIAAPPSDLGRELRDTARAADWQHFDVLLRRLGFPS